jgi:transposase-like protein
MASQLIHQENCEMNEHVLTEADAPTARGTRRPQRKYSAKNRKRLLRLFESREVSQKQFARDQGIPISTLSYWVRRSARERAAARVEVVEVPGRKLVAARLGQSIPQPSTEGVDIRLPNRFELRVSAGTDAQWASDGERCRVQIPAADLSGSSPPATSAT